MPSPKVLIVDDEREMCLSIQELLADEGYDASYIDDSRRVVDRVSRGDLDLVLMDIRMPGIGGMDLLQSVKRVSPALPVIMITGYPSVDTAVKAMKHGAVNYYAKPLDLGALIEEVRQVAKSAPPRRAEPAGLDGIVSRSPRILEMKKALRKAGGVNASVLITGESGTGKELFAGAIHHAGSRAAGPFVRVNCAAIPETLIESELFGHEEGAFTDAKRLRVGRFEQAQGGTLFLDEVGDLSLSAQAKILHALQERTFERVGGSRSISVDIRVVAATNRNLQAMIREGTFREDLFYRLSVISFEIPPLRERPGDVRLLTEHFIAEFSAAHGRPVSGAEEGVHALFAGHAWPGNIRELRNCVERAVVFADGPRIALGDLPSQYRQLEGGVRPDVYGFAVAELNREIIQDALSRSGGVKAKAADMLSVTRKTLYNRMKRLGM